MKAENKIIEKAIERLKEQTGLDVESVKTANRDKTQDYRIKINFEKKAINYMAEVKRNFSNTKLGDVLMQTKRAEEEPFILISEYITQPQAEKLRELGIPFFDTAGNVYLKEDGLYCFISGQKVQIKKEKSIKIFRPAGVKLILAFIAMPGLENFDYRTIAKKTGVTRTTVGRILNDLEKGGYLVKRAGQKRFLTRKPDLIRRWVIYYGEQFRLKLDPVKYHSTKFEGRWWNQVNIAEYNAVWGGETGGAKLTRHLKPQTATVYADSTLPKLQAKYGLVRVEQGEIEVLEKFWNFGEVENVAPPLVVYADLLATANERNIETAQLIYDKYLAQIAEEDS